MVDTTLLRMKMLEKGYTQERLKDELKIAIRTMNLKINGTNDFTCGEVQRMMELFKLTPQEVVKIFLTKK